MTAMRGLIALLCILCGPAKAVICTDAGDFTVCAVDPVTEDLRLFHSDDNGTVYGSFSAVEADVGPLSFAMNAGMYHEDRSPVGLYVEDGIQTMRLVTNAGPGNFGMLPNGVLCITENSARVIETLRFEADAPDCTYATQSGPMLVIDGALHPRFLRDSTSRNFRNGVGIGADGTAYFAISNHPVTFWEMGEFFRDILRTPNALYLDGRVSRLYAPQLGRTANGVRMGPIVGVVAP